MAVLPAQLLSFSSKSIYISRSQHLQFLVRIYSYLPLIWKQYASCAISLSIVNIPELTDEDIHHAHTRALFTITQPQERCPQQAWLESRRVPGNGAHTQRGVAWKQLVKLLIPSCNVDLTISAGRGV